ncbi:MAG: RDD family protein [Helicobacteraceae bacterium]|jgi:uncharacterized RDD family membrane protein YckC|nr:RDD family protein [Helicobacteraceae bacterium]
MKLEQDLAREQLAIASATKRAKAFALDEILIGAVVAFMLSDHIKSAEGVLEAIVVINSFFMWIVAIGVIYHTVFVALYGATIGKMWQNIAVITIDSLEKPPFYAALARAITRVFSEFVLYFGFFWAFLNPLRRTWHDVAAQVIVVDLNPYEGEDEII